MGYATLTRLWLCVGWTYLLLSTLTLRARSPLSLTRSVSLSVPLAFSTYSTSSREYIILKHFDSTCAVMICKFERMKLYNRRWATTHSPSSRTLECVGKRWRCTKIFASTLYSIHIFRIFGSLFSMREYYRECMAGMPLHDIHSIDNRATLCTESAFIVSRTALEIKAILKSSVSIVTTIGRGVNGLTTLSVTAVRLWGDWMRYSKRCSI